MSSEPYLPLSATPIGPAIHTAGAPNEGAPASPILAAQVLDKHAQLHDQLAHPNAGMTTIVEQFARWADERPDSWLCRYMFWPYRTGGKRESPAWASRFLVGLARGLFDAPTYQVTPGMCEIAEAMYRQTATVNGHTEPYDLPSESGFLWLDKPWRCTDANGLAYQSRAMSWQPVSTRWDEYDCRDDGVRVTFWSEWATDPGAAEAWAELDAVTQRQLEPLTLAFTAVQPFGASYAGEDTDRVPVPLHFAQALWLLLGTEIAVSSRGQVHRQARKRAMRSIRQHEVSVITLRRASHSPSGEHGHRDVDWSCRWIVRGFWRHLDGYGTVGRFHEARGDGRGNCLSCGARVTWVRPYVKGPEDQPLKDTRRVYRLSR